MEQKFFILLPTQIKKLSSLSNKKFFLLCIIEDLYSAGNKKDFFNPGKVKTFYIKKLFKWAYVEFILNFTPNIGCM